MRRNVPIKHDAWLRPQYALLQYVPTREVAASDPDPFLIILGKRWNMLEVKIPYTIDRDKVGQAQGIDAHDVVSLAISQYEKDLAFLQRMFDDASWTLYKSRHLSGRDGRVEPRPAACNTLRVSVAGWNLERRPEPSRSVA